MTRRIRRRPDGPGPRPRALSAVQAWWPAALSVTLGVVLLLQRWHWIALAPALAALFRIVFVTAVAAWIIGDVMRFIVWWFWTRQQP